jgi:hypothetical protein
MAVASQTQWRVTPGKQQEFMTNITQAKKIHQRLGGKVRVFLNSFGGPDTGTLVYRIEHADMATFAAFSDRMQADPEWQQLWSSVQGQSGPVATMTANSLLVEMPLPGGSGAVDAPSGAMAVVILQPAPGRQQQLQADIADAARIVESTGGRVRVWQAAWAGPRAGTFIITTSSADIGAFAASYQKLQASSEWQQFQARAAASGNLTLLSQSLVTELSVG